MANDQPSQRTEVTPSTFAEAENLMQVRLTAACEFLVSTELDTLGDLYSLASQLCVTQDREWELEISSHCFRTGS